MQWTSIGESSTRMRVPPQVVRIERELPRELPRERRAPTAPKHSAKNWARLLADLKARFER